MTDIGYTSTEELARLLKIRSPTMEQDAALVRVLTTAYVEIQAEIDLGLLVELTEDQEQLAAEVQLERGVEHWQQSESPFGLIGIGSELGPTHTATNSWTRHAEKLAPLKSQWGLS